MLTVRIDDIKEKGLLLEGESSAEAFPQLKRVAEAGDVSFPHPIRYRLDIHRLAEMVEVEGRIETTFELSCSRCLETYRTPFRSDFELAYASELPDVTDEDGTELELSADDLGLNLLEGDDLELDEPVEEQVLMALPIQPLCREACKGLCPQCGANMNENPCQCEEPQFDTRFSALKDFKVKK